MILEGEAHMSLHGRFDTSNVANLGGALVLEAGKLRRGESFLIDASDIGYLSSAPCRLLVAANEILREEKGSGLVLINPSVRVTEILEMVGLTWLTQPLEERDSTI